jgi:hypothetical protein
MVEGSSAMGPGLAIPLHRTAKTRPRSTIRRTVWTERRVTINKEPFRSLDDYFTAGKKSKNQRTPAGTFYLPRATAISDPIYALRFDRRVPGPPILAARAPMDLRGLAHLPVRNATHARDI